MQHTNKSKLNMQRRIKSKSNSTNKKSIDREIKREINKDNVKTLAKLWTNVVFSAAQSNVISGPLPALNPSTAVGPYNRVSDSIYVRKIHHRLSITIGSNSTNIMRLVCVQRKGSVSVSANDLFFAYPFTGNRDIWSFVNTYSAKQVNIIFDKTFTLVAGGDTATHMLEFCVVPPIRNWNFNYGTNALNIGQLDYYLVSDSGAGSAPVVNWNSMLHFDDDL